ncbi:MAG TPA: hypothetical protein VH599_16330 [Ktedonobacterales bacterium]|jgi:hypothetical protein
MSQSSSARTWAIVSVVGGALALIGFFVPWFFATGAPEGEFTVSGWRLFLAVPQAIQEDIFFTPGFIIITLLPLVVLLSALAILVGGFLKLIGRSARWLTVLQPWAAGLGLLYLVLGVAAFELLFQALASFDVPNPDAALFPGVGVWLMFVGFVVTLVASLRSLRERTPTAAPQP